MLSDWFNVAAEDWGCWQSKVMAAATGEYHSAAVGEDGALFVWGSGADGQLGTGDTASRLAPTRVAGLPAPVRQVAAGSNHTGIVTEAGDLLMCGGGEYGHLRLGDEEFALAGIGRASN